MAIEPRPVDLVTKQNLFVGTPIVLFEREISTGVFDTPLNLGIVDNAELQKVVQLLDLNNAQSGLTQLERRAVGGIQPALQLGLFNFEPNVMRYMLGSKAVTTLAASTVAVTDDEVTVPNSFDKFAVFDNRNLTTEPLTDLDCKTITSEAVGTGQGGTFGETQGDFALDFPVFVIGDITSYLEGGVERVGDLVAGAAPMAGQIGVIVGASATSGEITYPAGEAPAAGDAIVVTYTPSFTFTNGTDYVLDPFEGRIRFLDTDKVRANQVVLADYSYSRVDTTRLSPFTQNAFSGRATVKQLTDIGINFIWTIPSVSIRLTDDALTWDNENFATGTLIMDILSDGTSAPYGVFDQYPETPAVC